MWYQGIYFMPGYMSGLLGFKSVMGTILRGRKRNYRFVVVYISVTVC